MKLETYKSDISAKEIEKEAVRNYRKEQVKTFFVNAANTIGSVASSIAEKPKKGKKSGFARYAESIQKYGVNSGYSSGYGSSFGSSYYNSSSRPTRKKAPSARSQYNSIPRWNSY